MLRRLCFTYHSRINGIWTYWYICTWNNDLLRKISLYIPLFNHTLLLWLQFWFVDQLKETWIYKSLGHRAFVPGKFCVLLPTHHIYGLFADILFVASGCVCLTTLHRWTSGYHQPHLGPLCCLFEGSYGIFCCYLCFTKLVGFRNQDINWVCPHQIMIEY